ncbi:hypothetical protein DF185_05350 [Marinifilum breve]|uniref:Uncharacterized protein n=1 Tax=Marinifilum breve TaxID=2184082 RepID=A0A2V4A0J2_9BACT|nr:hypothetical protein [Marinifilum breve]PXY02071.1 hypothetical protein DF185_05350 [Marinifilum breve]
MSFILTIITTIKSFISSSEEEYSEKTENFIEKAPAYVEQGILPKEATEALIAELQEVERLRKEKNECLQTARNKRQELTGSKSTCNKSLRNYKNEIDSDPTIPENVKRELGLLNEKKTEETNNKRPKLKVEPIAGVPRITYQKKPMDGIKLYSKTNDGEYNFETTVNRSSFDDTRGRISNKEVEIREYYAYYIYDGKEVGKKSNVVRVVLEPIE